MSQSPAKNRPWLHWPPTRGEWREALWLLGTIALCAGFFVACAALGIDPQNVFTAALAGVFTALLLLFVLTMLMFAWALLAGLLKRL